jgi:CBS domain-containing protein
MKVRDYMSRDVVTVRPATGIMQLVHLLTAREVAGAIVTDDDNMVLGIITERDCISVAIQAGYFDEPGGTVAEFMQRNVEAFGADDSLLDVAQGMVGSSHRLFPVTDNGRLIGMLSRRDVLRALTTGAWFKSAAESG